MTYPSEIPSLEQPLPSPDNAGYSEQGHHDNNDLSGSACDKISDDGANANRASVSFSPFSVRSAMHQGSGFSYALDDDDDDDDDDDVSPLPRVAIAACNSLD